MTAEVSTFLDRVTAFGDKVALAKRASAPLAVNEMRRALLDLMKAAEALPTSEAIIIRKVLMPTPAELDFEVGTLRNILARKNLKVL